MKENMTELNQCKTHRYKDKFKLKDGNDKAILNHERSAPYLLI